MLFYPVFNKKIYLSTFATEICLFFSFALRFSLVNYFFAFSLLVFQMIVLLQLFCHFEGHNKSKCLTKTHCGCFLHLYLCRTTYIYILYYLDYMLFEYFQMFSDKINKCKSRIFTNVRILLFKKFSLGTLVFINCNLELLIKLSSWEKWYKMFFLIKQ